MKKIILLVLLFFQAISYSQNCDCFTTFKSVQHHVENNYAGWFDKNKQFNQDEFKTLTNNIEEECKKSKSDSLCFVSIKKYTSFFKDGHLRLKFYSKSKKSNTNASETPILIETIALNEKQILNYLKNTKKLDKIEGIWENDTYKLGIIRSKSKEKNKFNGIVITTENSNWKPFEVKITIVKDIKNNYIASFTSGDKTVITTKNVKLISNILDADPMFLSKKNADSKNFISLNDYLLENDPTNPKLTFPKEDLAVFSFPNFYDQNREIVTQLLEKHKDKIAKAKYWIIDLRNNEGGNVEVGNLLLPYLYTKPIISHKTKFRLTEENYTNWFKTYVKETYDNWDEKNKRYYDSILNLSKKHYGEFREIYNSDKIADTISFKDIKVFPQKVGILTNSETISSGELFTFLAKQSDKVKIYGQNSAGVIDYGNILTYKTNCPFISITLPCDRYNWLDQGISIDRDKIQPDILINENIKDWIDFTYTDFKK